MNSNQGEETVGGTSSAQNRRNGLINPPPPRKVAWCRGKGNACRCFPAQAW